MVGLLLGFLALFAMLAVLAFLLVSQERLVLKHSSNAPDAPKRLRHVRMRAMMLAAVTMVVVAVIRAAPDQSLVLRLVLAAAAILLLVASLQGFMRLFRRQ